jgi:glycosyltransferase involved in cell wall biosynthesis
MEKEKILFISSWFPDRLTRTNGDFTKRHAQAVSSKFSTVFLFIKYDPSMEGQKEIIESKDGNYTEVLFYFNFKSRFLPQVKKLLRYLKLYIQGYNYIRTRYFEPDIIHANITFPIGLIALLYKILYKKPYIISEHWSAYLSNTDTKIPFFQRVIDRLVVRKAGRIVPVTENLKNSMIDLGYKGKYSIVPNVVDIKAFTSGNIETGKKKNFIHLSSLYEHVKNISGIIEAVRRLSEMRQDFQFHFLGGEELENHIARAMEKGVLDRFIIFHGELPYDEVPAYYAKSICLVMFSNYESLPCVIVEALACGIPVISTDVGGIKEYISAKEGILIPKGQIDSLVEAMNYMLDNYHLFDKEHLVSFAKENFSIEAVTDKFGNIYKSVLMDA